MKIFQIRDLKAEGFLTPFFADTAGLAMRTLQQRIPADDPMQIYAADFALYEAGTWDAQTGEISGFISPVFVIELMNLFEPEKSPAPTHDSQGRLESDKYHGITKETTPNGS